MRIAVVGAGVAGLGAAWSLSRHHEVVVYEREGRFGGHSCTVDVPSPDGRQLVIVVPSAASLFAPLPLLVALVSLVLLIADAGLAANLYSTREWEELEDEVVRERHPRRRVAGR